MEMERPSASFTVDVSVSREISSWVGAGWIVGTETDGARVRATDAAAHGANIFPSRHDTRTAFTSIHWKIEETYCGGPMDARGQAIVDGRTYRRVYALERDGV
jgi:hypothetical protein